MKQFPRITCPPELSGPFSECLKRDPFLTEARWYRGQMRSWAGYWRERKAIAAAVGSSVAECADTYLSLAKSYRDSSRQAARKARILDAVFTPL